MRKWQNGNGEKMRKNRSGLSPGKPENSWVGADHDWHDRVCVLQAPSPTSELIFGVGNHLWQPPLSWRATRWSRPLFDHLLCPSSRVQVGLFLVHVSLVPQNKPLLVRFLVPPAGIPLAKPLGERKSERNEIRSPHQVPRRQPSSSIVIYQLVVLLSMAFSS